MKFVEQEPPKKHFKIKILKDMKSKHKKQDLMRVWGGQDIVWIEHGTV